MKKTECEKKLKELIVYISSKCADDVKFGGTKLNKILFYSDFLYYKKKQKSISDCPYIHQQYGPVPDDMKKLLKKMNGIDIGTAIAYAGPYIQKKIVALREPNLSNFDADMIAHVDSIINIICNKRSFSATQLSDMTHQTMGWRVTSDGQEIPYQTIFIKDKKYQVATAWEKTRAKEIAKKLAGQYGFPSEHNYNGTATAV
ncbi:SocA family protein [Patescibacteria group bacterium]|nr:SocA family protein [Patescibacteria group bacterium]